METALQPRNRRHRRYLDDRDHGGGADICILDRNKAFLPRACKMMRPLIIPVYVIQFTFFVTLGILAAREMQSWHQERAALTVMTYTLHQLTESEI